MFVPATKGGHPRYAATLVSAIADATALRLIYVGPKDAEIVLPSTAVETALILPPIRQSNEYSVRAAWAVSRVIHYSRRDLRLIRWVLGRPDVGVLHLQEDLAPWMFPVVVAVCWIRGFRLVATIHNVRPHAAGARLSRLRQRMSLLTTKHLAHAFIHAGMDADAVAKELGLPRPRISVIQHGLFGEEATSLPTDRRHLLFFGSWRRNKGLKELVEAMELLPQWKLTVAGAAVDAGYAAECRGVAFANVTFVEGFVDESDVAPLFSRASACVLPYTQLDAQSGVLHLALGAGRPVVVTPVGGMASIVHEYGCGVVSEGPTREDIAAAIQLLESDQVFESLCDGVAEAQAGLGWASAASATAAVYGRLLGVTGDD
jgi:glycosyltransferase involved in cell wall biosynthesis